MTKRKRKSRSILTPTEMLSAFHRSLCGLFPNSEARRSGKPVSPTPKGEPDMKQRRVIMELEIETDVAGAQLRKRAWWNAWLAAAPVTVLQAGVNVIRASKAASKAKPAKKKAKASR